VEEEQKEKKKKEEEEEAEEAENGRTRAVCGDNEQNVDSTTLVKPDI